MCICVEVDAVANDPIAIIFCTVVQPPFFFSPARHEYANLGASSQTCNLEVLFIFFSFAFLSFQPPISYLTEKGAFTQ